VTASGEDSLGAAVLSPDGGPLVEHEPPSTGKDRIPSVRSGSALVGRRVAVYW
jgi:hypothetical protein